MNSTKSQKRPGEKTSASKTRRSLRDIAFAKIKQQIIARKLKPGEVLSEAVLSETLKIGRTPVHQAIGLLESEGFVEVVPRKGVIVKPLSLDEAIEIVEVRLLAESYCASAAARKIDAEGIRALHDNLDQMRRAIEDRKSEKVLQIDGDFHRTIASLGGNMILYEILSKLHDRATRFWFVSLQDIEQQNVVLKQHETIVAAIEAGDEEKANQVMRAHIEQFIANLTRQF